ncbi:MAG: sulfatase-like hydrolase/transferase [Planctomycetaceae bacterium]
MPEPVRGSLRGTQQNRLGDTTLFFQLFERHDRETYFPEADLAACRLLFVAFRNPAFVCGGEQPNVVVFLADDAGWGDYSHSGNTMVNTPHIDSLARQVSLELIFCLPVCSPTGPNS